jgi:uncharacterized protein (DUF2141 family)
MLDKPSENVIVTPPQTQLPVIRAVGRKAVVELKDTLQKNTTYTIDFTNSISDNNEKNVLENYTFAFSTGDVIDSLEVSGYLLNADNLEPMPGITIGLHKNLEDSAFVKEAFMRTSRTNERGRFIIHNIPPGTYHIFALNDKNRNYRFDMPSEEIAFSDSLIIPTFDFATRQDTLWKDSLTIDTIRTVGYTRFMPDDIDLRLFAEKFERQYALRPERTEANHFTLRFNAPLDTMPTPIPLNFSPADSLWYVSQWMEEKKAVNYWLTDSLVWALDTLAIEVTYLASDSLNQLIPRTDTLNIIQKSKPAEVKKKKKGDAEESIVFLGMSINASGALDIFSPVSVVFNEPVLDLDKELFRFEQQLDTLWVPVTFDFFPDSANALGYIFRHEWNYNDTYRLTVDSAVVFSIYGKWNNKVNQQFSINAKEQYGHLYLNIQGLADSIPAFVELLNNSDAPVRKEKVSREGGALFMDLPPGKYAARLIADENDNSVWDTGNYAEKRQPERVYYYPKILDVAKNWEVEETWDIQAVPAMRQKPLEITKNKPKEANKAKRDYKNEGRNQSSGNNSNPMGRSVRF